MNRHRNLASSSNALSVHVAGFVGRVFTGIVFTAIGVTTTVFATTAAASSPSSGPFGLHSSPEASESPWAIGTAWSHDGKHKLYREIHFAEESRPEMSSRVLYFDSAERLVAEKTLDYSTSPFAPSLSLLDHRNQIAVSAEHLSGDARTIQVEFSSEQSSRRSQIRYRDSLLIDAGFDVFIRDSWEQLLGGERILGSFLVPSRLEAVRVGITRTEETECRTEQEDISCFVVRPAGLLRAISFFVEPIRLAYDNSTKRLVMFDGTSNLADEDGNNHSVLIHFEYP